MVRLPGFPGGDSGEADTALIENIRTKLHPLTGDAADLDPVLHSIGDAPLVLLGEASHGTSEFYSARAELTMRLVREKGFNAVAVEADWPDAHRVDCYIRGRGNDRTAEEALRSFERFPTWMWRNTVVQELVGRLRAHNDGLAEGVPKVGFYGIDLYSMHSSAEAVLNYLRRVDPDAAKQAQERYSCFDHAGGDPQYYGQAVAFKMKGSCEQEVVAQLIDLRHKAFEYANRNGQAAEEDFFNAEMNAALVRDAEKYYRGMFSGRVNTWNLRDQHMADTLDALRAHLQQQGQSGKIIVWAHNSHLGDARATEMGEQGEWNVGQLMRERHGNEAVLLGFTTYTGTVTATTNWGETPQRKHVRRGLPGSLEDLLHSLGSPRFFLELRDPQVRAAFEKPLLQRAIGVIYRPDTERQSHYFQTRTSAQFDGLLHFDETSAVEPLERNPHWDREGPDTFPSGL